MALNKKNSPRDFPSIDDAVLSATGHPNPLSLLSCPFQTPDSQRQRFLFRGDATQPVTGIKVSNDISSRYQIPTATSLPVQIPFRLKILHFNDFHGRISHLSATGNAPVFSRIASRYKQQQQKYRENAQAGVLMLSAGDDMRCRQRWTQLLQTGSQCSLLGSSLLDSFNVV